MTNPLRGVYASEEDAEKNGYTPAQIFALATAGGSGRRVWFAEPQAKEKEQWLLDARSVWLKEIALRTKNFSDIPAERLVSVCQQTSAPPAQSDLARRFVALFGADKNTARELSCLAAGCDPQESSGALSLSTLFKDIIPLARKASSEEAWACVERERGQRAWAPTGASLEPGERAASWDDVESQTRRMLSERSLRYMAIDGDISAPEAFAIIRDMDAGLRLIERETGLGPGSSGLARGPGGGWGVEIGSCAGAEGKCYWNYRKIELSLNGGDGSLAHEWFHALDAELEALDAKRSTSMGMASETGGGSNGYGALLENLVDQLKASGVESLANPSDTEWKFETLRADLLMNSGTRLSVAPNGLDAFDAEWEKSVREFLEASTPKLESEALEAFVKTYQKVNPSLEKDDFLGVFAGMREIKSPSKKTLMAIEKASENSDFYLQAVLADISKKEVYMTQKCELLARAFESAFALDAAHEATGLTGAVSMVSGTLNGSSRAPRGEERNRARLAFMDFFKELGSRLAADPNAPAWARMSQAEPNQIRFAERLAARRGNEELAKKRTPALS